MPVLRKKQAQPKRRSSYNRGYAEGYYKAATELAAADQGAGDGGPVAAAAPCRAVSVAATTRRRTPSRSITYTTACTAATAAPQSTQPAQPRAAAPAAPAAPAVSYVSVSVGEAINILVFAGCQPRDIVQNKDNSLRATFSSWGSMMLHEQVSRIQNADPRIVVLESGKLESHDYFIDFAFKES